MADTDPVNQNLAAVTLVVRDYDEAIAYYTQMLDFVLLEDTPMGNDKRWVRVAPRGTTQVALLLAQAQKPGLFLVLERAQLFAHQLQIQPLHLKFDIFCFCRHILLLWLESVDGLRLRPGR